MNLTGLPKMGADYSNFDPRLLLQLVILSEGFFDQASPKSFSQIEL
jgi:hypothetical protein